jgi:succinate-acetate transporter protein
MNSQVIKNNIGYLLLILVIPFHLVMVIGSLKLALMTASVFVIIMVCALIILVLTLHIRTHRTTEVITK